MGYYTNYEYEEGFDAEAFEELNKISRYNHPCMDEVKWYEWENDMKALSTVFPDRTFILSGVVEGRDDEWKAYFKKGVVKIIEPVKTWPNPPVFEV